MTNNCNALGGPNAPIVFCADSVQSTGWHFQSTANGQEQFFLVLITAHSAPFVANLGMYSVSASMTSPILPIIDHSICPGSHNINVKTFIDQNQNGLLDANESIFYTTSTAPSIIPLPQYWYSFGNAFNSPNGYSFVVFNPGAPSTHTVTSPTFPNYSFTTPSSYTLTFNNNTLTYDTLLFGLYPSTTVSDIEHIFHYRVEPYTVCLEDLLLLQFQTLVLNL